MVGIFRKPFLRRPPRRIVPTVAVPTVEVPGLRRRDRLAMRRSVALRVADKIRQVPRLPLLGIRQPGAPRLNIARLVMDRGRKFIRERMARERFVPPTFPIPAAVSATPFAPRIPLRPEPRRAVARSRPVQPTGPAVPGATPFVFKPIIRPVRALLRVKKIHIPGIFVPGVNSTPFVPLITIRLPRALLRVRRLHIPGLFVPGVNSTPFVRFPFYTPPIRIMIPRRFLPGSVIPPDFLAVCTDGVWSAVITFASCDDFRIVIDGPGADGLKISATIELEEF